MSNAWGKALEEFNTSLKKDTTYEPIPDNTKAPAEIRKVETKEWQGEKYFNVHYKLTAGDFKNRMIFQKFKVFAENEDGDKARIRLIKFIKACCTEVPKEMPDETMLKQLEGIEIGLTISLFECTDGVERNVVRWTDKLDSNFKIETGKKKEDEGKATTEAYEAWSNEAKSKESEKKDEFLNDDIPF